LFVDVGAGVLVDAGFGAGAGEFGDTHCPFINFFPSGLVQTPFMSLFPVLGSVQTPFMSLLPVLGSVQTLFMNWLPVFGSVQTPFMRTLPAASVWLVEPVVVFMLGEDVDAGFDVVVDEGFGAVLDGAGVDEDAGAGPLAKWVSPLLSVTR
jgi:hypothetical protein